MLKFGITFDIPMDMEDDSWIYVITVQGKRYE